MCFANVFAQEDSSPGESAVKFNTLQNVFHKILTTRMQQILRLRPVYQERVWGGRGLETSLHRSLPPGRPIGESWEIVDRPEAQSVVTNGSLAGQSLRELNQNNAASVLGPRWLNENTFPNKKKKHKNHKQQNQQKQPPTTNTPQLK